ncbi:mitochondrial 2-enoyl thioester reductase [Tulasnella sp. 418]|nr:mitochondrial 2-enoyl thioester reductase [Tulasnella sp. 418]
MSKSPLSLPTSLFIFKNLTSHGYWQSRWYKQHSRAEREDMLKEVIDLIESQNLKEPVYEIVPLKGSDDEVNHTLANTLKTIADGSHGKKFLLKWETE